MRSLKELLGLPRKLFRVAAEIKKANRNGMDLVDVVNATTNLWNRVSIVTGGIRKEKNLQARYIFSGCILPLSGEGEIRITTTWKDYFDLLSRGIEEATPMVAALNDPEATASLGRIDHYVTVFKNWYEQQDPRLETLFNTLGSVRGIQTEVMDLCHEGEYVVMLEGKSEPVKFVIGG